MTTTFREKWRADAQPRLAAMFDEDVKYYRPGAGASTLVATVKGNVSNRRRGALFGSQSGEEESAHIRVPISSDGITEVRVGDRVTIVETGETFAVVGFINRNEVAAVLDCRREVNTRRHGEGTVKAP